MRGVFRRKPDVSMVEAIEEELSRDTIDYLEREDLALQGIGVKEVLFIKKHIQQLG